MEHLPTSFHCPHCAYQLVLTLPSNGPVSGPCPVCANVITFEPQAQAAPLESLPELEPAVSSPTLLNRPEHHYRRSKFAGKRRTTRNWFRSEIDEPATSDDVPLVIKRRSKSSFVRPERLADRLARLSQGTG